MSGRSSAYGGCRKMRWMEFWNFGLHTREFSWRLTQLEGGPVGWADAEEVGVAQGWMVEEDGNYAALYRPYLPISGLVPRLCSFHGSQCSGSWSEALWMSVWGIRPLSNRGSNLVEMIICNRKCLLTVYYRYQDCKLLKTRSLINEKSSLKKSSNSIARFRVQLIATATGYSRLGTSIWVPHHWLFRNSVSRKLELKPRADLTSITKIFGSLPWLNKALWLWWGICWLLWNCR
jgi:hypothetical protein